MPNDNDDFNRRLIDELATEALREQRARRRWSVFFKSAFLLYLFTLTALYFYSAPSPGKWEDSERFAAVIQISGAIDAGGQNAARNINALLRSAFADENSAGVILEINSPGGSAVESHRIYNEIRRLREKHPDKEVIAVAGDLCASGGYFIAAAADSIYADRASIIGSIGVIFSGFGFVDALDKLGVERRVQTAGGNKNLFDPFLPQREEDRQVMEAILDDVHRVFRQAVLDGRGERLNSNDARVFSGALFSGEDSAALGLIDGFDDVGGVARDFFGVETVRYFQHRSWLEKIADQFGLLSQAPAGIRAVGLPFAAPVQ